MFILSGTQTRTVSPVLISCIRYYLLISTTPLRYCYFNPCSVGLPTATELLLFHLHSNSVYPNLDFRIFRYHIQPYEFRAKNRMISLQEIMYTLSTRFGIDMNVSCSFQCEVISVYTLSFVNLLLNLSFLVLLVNHDRAIFSSKVYSSKWGQASMAQLKFLLDEVLP